VILVGNDAFEPDDYRDSNASVLSKNVLVFDSRSFKMNDSVLVCLFIYCSSFNDAFSILKIIQQGWPTRSDS
jgi:hypothetical protein